MSQLHSQADRLVVALDGDSLVCAQELVELLSGRVKNFEVGIELFMACGPAVIDMIHEADAQVFLDLKFHDIPSTVAKAAAVAARMGVEVINIHASGGCIMMEEALNAVRGVPSAGNSKLIAVTVLTSMQTLGDVGVQYEIREQVTRLTAMAAEVGLDGVNVSPLEIAQVREQCGDDFLIVSPGIRLAGNLAYDQRRVAGPGQAIRAGADYIVVGRPITQSREPLRVVDQILSDIGQAVTST